MDIVDIIILHDDISHPTLSLFAHYQNQKKQQVPSSKLKTHPALTRRRKKKRILPKKTIQQQCLFKKEKRKAF
jgi:hypothetical protein